jgi:hypothetical protein
MGKITHICRFSKTLLCCLVLTGSVSACDKGGFVTVERPTNVLEKPFPENYPSTNPEPNAVIAVLEKGVTVELLGDKHGKDYKVYKVRLNDGRTGYILYEKDAVRVSPQKR